MLTSAMTKAGVTLLDRLQAGLTTDSPESTTGLGNQLAEIVPENTVLAVQGDLGAGKTTFVKGLACGFGIRDTVTSPTFNLLQVYRGRRTLLHLDAYRLEGGQAVDGVLLDDLFIPPWNLVVEWPEQIASWLPASTWWIAINCLDAHRRRFSLRKKG